MAGDWIKMRTDLYRDPKVCVIADRLLAEGSNLARYVSQHCQRDMTVTRNVTRNVTVGALVSVWGVMRHRGKRVGDDLVCKNVGLTVIDDVADLPGFGEAMKAAGWAIESNEGLKFPNFFEEYNVDPTEDKKSKNSERQRRHREKMKRDSNVTVTSQSNAREEKSREEKSINTPKSPKGTEEYSPEFLKFWEIFPPRRKDKKRATWKAWQSAIKRKAAEDILAAAGEYAASPKGRGEFCSGPVPWLNGDCWDDDRRSWSDGKQGDLFGQRPAHPNEPIPTRTGKVDWRNPGTT
jgi:hypothetical protein